MTKFQTVEQLQATISEQAAQYSALCTQVESLTAEIKRLRALVETAFDEGLGHSFDLDHPHDVYWLASEARAALQPKEG